MAHWLHALGTPRSLCFAEWLAAHPDPRVCWYPSAGADVDDLVYLSEAYQRRHPAQPPNAEVAPPDVFLHTDCNPSMLMPLEVGRGLGLDPATRVVIDAVEELERLTLPIDSPLLDASGSATYDMNRVFLLWLSVSNDVLGRFERPMIYVVAENATFCARVLIPHRARLSHVVCIRHGAGPGGPNRATGAWLRALLPALRAEVFVAEDRPDILDDGDDVVFQAFPVLATARRRRMTKLTELRRIAGNCWSGPGDWVKWYRVA